MARSHGRREQPGSRGSVLELLQRFGKVAIGGGTLFSSAEVLGQILPGQGRDPHLVADPPFVAPAGASWMGKKRKIRSIGRSRSKWREAQRVPCDHPAQGSQLRDAARTGAGRAQCFQLSSPRLGPTLNAFPA